MLAAFCFTKIYAEFWWIYLLEISLLLDEAIHVAESAFLIFILNIFVFAILHSLKIFWNTHYKKKKNLLKVYSEPW